MFFAESFAMPITVSLSNDARRLISLTNSGQSGVSVTASQTGTTLTFTPSDGTAAQTVQVPLGWSGITIGSNVTLTISASLVVSKALLGSGTAIALAPISGGDLSQQALYADIIQLTAGQAYTLSSAQAAIARIDGGSLGNLSSTGAITVVAANAGDLSGLTLDAGDAIVLSAGLDYTLTAAQALIARVGSTGKAGVLTSTGAITIKASTAADLTAITTDSNDTLILSAGAAYTLSSGQVAVAQVGANGTKGDLSTAGTILVKAAVTGDAQLFAMTGIGVDIIQLTAGQAYTLTPAQVAITRVGATGSMGNLTSSGVITIKADTAGADLSSLSSDSNDVFLLGANLPYTLTSQQAAKSKVVSGSVQGAAGDLRTAGIVTVVANTSGENLAATPLQGVDFFVLTAGSDYVLTSAQAKYSKVTSTGALGALGGAGLVSIKGTAGEDFTNTLIAAGITGTDVILINPGQNFTMTAEQARTARMVDTAGVVGKSAALTSTGVITVKADSAGTDLTTIGTDSNDVIVLGAGLNYTLTSTQAVTATVATGSSAGSLSKTANLTVVAPSLGGDLSGLSTVTGIQAVVLTPGQKYSLPTSLASVVKVGSGNLGVFTNAGPLTATASTSEDLSSNPLALAASAILLTAGQNYTLTSGQAALARFSASGTLGDLRQTGAAKAGTITLNAAGATDISGLLIDSNVTINLSNNQSLTLTAAQALRSSVAGGATGDLSAAGVVIIKAPSSGTTPLDLSGIVVGGSDVLQLSGGGSYILSKAQVPLARVNGGVPGDLSKAGIISVNAAAGDNLTGLASGYSGIDTYLLAAGANYTLTNTQAALSKVGTTALGVLTSTGVLTVVANPGADISGLSTDGNDIIQLTSGANYTLTLAQALTAQLVTTTNNGTIYGNLGQLDSSGTLTLRTPAGTAPTDLSTQLSGITGIDTIVLNAGQAYTLTGSQAGISQMGTSGSRGDLISAGVITLLAGSTTNLAAIKTDSNDIVQLDDATDYTLTAAQAAGARIGATGKAGVITSNGVLRVLAQVSADLSTLGTDSNDVIVLWPGQRYALTTAQAARACVWTGSADGTQQDLSAAGYVRVVAISAAKSTEDLTGLKLESSDNILLTAGVNYILTAQQAAIAQIGATGKVGDLVGGTANAGNITVKASASADLSGLKLDNLGDQILLASVVGSNRCDYILSSSQVGIAQVDTGVVGDFGAAGTVILRAATTGEDLSTGPVLSALGIDVFQLSPMQNYTLLASQVPLARVGSSGTVGTDLSVAGVVNVKADIENLTALATVKGIDNYILTPGTGYTLAPSQALLAKIGPTGTPGVLTSSGKISILATTAADLSPLVTDSGDAITLGVGQNYTLNPAQLGVASVYTPASGNTTASLSTAGDLTAAGVVTLRAEASTDLSILTATGIDAIALTVGRDYTMTTAQANMATVGTGAVGALSKAGNITLKPSGAGENFATSLANVSGYDTLQLNEAVNYSLTAAQAAIARIGPLGTVGNLVSTGVLTVTATGSANLSGLVLDSGDSVLLTRGNFNYTLSAAQAAIASMTGSGANSLPGQLAHSSGTVTVVANPKGENLSGLIFSGLDAIVLSAGQNYTLTTAQATIAKVGTAGTLGNLIKAGTITLTNINGSGNDDLLVGGRNADTIVGAGGDDTMTGGLGRDVFLLSGTAAVNGTDTITDFLPGAGGDVLNISTFMTRDGTGVSTALTPLTSTGALTATTGNVFIYNAGAAITGKNYASAADFGDIFAASSKPLSTTTAAGLVKGVLVVQGTDLTKVYYIDKTLDNANTNISVSDVALVATLVGVTNADTLDNSNFV